MAYYQEPVAQPGLAGQIFGGESAVGTWWEMQKNSMLMTYAFGGTNWKGFQMGEGMRNSGLFGFRSVLGGAQAFKGSAPNILGKAIAGTMDVFGFNDASAKFRKSGLLRYGGAINKSKAKGGNQVMDWFGKALGGSEAVWADRPLSALVADVAGVTKKGGQRQQELVKALRSMEKTGTIDFPTDRGVRPVATKRSIVSPYKEYKNKARVAWDAGVLRDAQRVARYDQLLLNDPTRIYGESVDILRGQKRMGFGRFSVTRPGQGVVRVVRAARGIITGGGDAFVHVSTIENKFALEGARKGLRAASGKIILGAAGGALSKASSAAFAFSIAKMAFQGAVNVAGNTLDTLESGMSRVSNTSMEFGGNVTAGFYGTQSSTDRQRAMRAISQTGFTGRRAIGSEAALGHVGSTW